METNQHLVTEEKARELRNKYLGQDLVDMLTAPTPTEPDEFGKWIEERPARGGTMVRYVPGHRFIQRLNDCFGFFWSYEVPEQFELNGQIVAKGELSVTIPGRTLTRKLPDGTEETVRFDTLIIKKTQFGSSEVKRYSGPTKDKAGNIVHKTGDVIDLGDDYKGAATDAMKKCATQFGMFQDVYSGRGEEEGVASKTQLDVFYWRAEEAGMSKEEAEKWAEEELGTPFKGMDQLEVMGLIPRLMDIAKAKEKEGD